MPPKTLPFGSAPIQPLQASAKPKAIPFGSNPLVPNAENAPAQKPFRFDVPETREQKIARYKQEADAAAAESAKQNSSFGMAKNFGKALVKNIAPSEVNLGETIGSIANTLGGNVDRMSQTIDQLEGQKVASLKKIRELEAAGKDASLYKQDFNRAADQADELRAEMEKTTAGSQKSTLKVAGELGGVALDILTAGSYGKRAAGLKTGELGKAAPSVLPKGPGGIFTRQAAKDIAKGAGTGYLFDVTRGLQGDRGADREGANALTPGIGTVVGGAIPAAIHSVQTVKDVASKGFKEGLFPTNVDKIVENRTKEITRLEDSYKDVRRVSDKAKAKGVNVKKVLSETDLLNGAVDNTGTIRTENATRELNDFIKPQEDVISQNLKREGVSISLKDVEKKLVDQINSSGIKGGAKVRALKAVSDDIAGYALEADANGRVPLSMIHDAKVDKYAGLNFFNPESKRVDKAIARGLKQLVEENTKSVDVAKLNKELAAHYAVLDLLEKLDGKKVAGGKLGKYFAQTIGGIVGSHFGPLGTIAGAEIGGAVKGASMASKLSGKTGKSLEVSEAMKGAIDQGKQPRLGLPAPAPGTPTVQNNIPIRLRGPNTIEPAAPIINNQSSLNNLGSRNISQSNTIIPKASGAIDNSVPQIVSADTLKYPMPKGMEKLAAKLDSFVQQAIKDGIMTADDAIGADSSLVDFIRKNGVDSVPPIQVSRLTNKIVDGVHRFDAFKTLGIKDIPVIFVD